MKVLVLANLGMGLYKFRKELLQEFVKRKFEVHISLPSDAYIKKLEAIGCIFHETAVDRRGTNPITDLRLLFKYVQLIRQIKPNIVLTFTVKPNIYGGLACRMSKTPYIANVTGLGTSIENNGPIQRIVLALYKCGLKESSCVFFQNKANLVYFMHRAIVCTKAKVIPGSGVNLEQHHLEPYPGKDEPIRLLFIGRIMKEKGIDELLEAAKRIKLIDARVQFDLIGFCEEMHADYLAALSQAGIVNFLGQQDDVHAFIKQAHAIILPSYHEGMSNVLLESASTGRPVLASRVPGCIETFEDGVSGISFEAMNTDSLVDAIHQFINMPLEKKKSMGLAGRKKMEHEYDRLRVIQNYLGEIMYIVET
jgi:glycosyltransferase involved in cell wall biosynthesis